MDPPEVWRLTFIPFRDSSPSPSPSCGCRRTLSFRRLLNLFLSFCNRGSGPGTPESRVANLGVAGSGEGSLFSTSDGREGAPITSTCKRTLRGQVRVTHFLVIRVLGRTAGRVRQQLDLFLLIRVGCDLLVILSRLLVEHENVPEGFRPRIGGEQNSLRTMPHRHLAIPKRLDRGVDHCGAIGSKPHNGIAPRPFPFRPSSGP